MRVLAWGRGRSAEASAPADTTRNDELIKPRMPHQAKVRRALARTCESSAPRSCARARAAENREEESRGRICGQKTAGARLPRKRL